MRNVADSSCTENGNTHFVFNTFFLNHALYEIMWKNTVESSWRQRTIWRMRIACWIPEATNTHSEYVIQLSPSNSGYTNAPQCYVCTYFASLV